MTTIADLVQQGKAQLEAERERLAQAARLSEASKQAKFAREWAGPIDFLKAAWPQLADCFQAPEYKPEEYLDGQLPRGFFEVGVSVPGLDWFEVQLDRTAEGYQFAEPAIRLYRSYKDQSVYGGEYYLGRDKRNPITLESGSLPVALALADEYARERQGLALEVEQANQAVAARREASYTKAQLPPTDAERALALVGELVNLVHVHREDA